MSMCESGPALFNAEGNQSTYHNYNLPHLIFPIPRHQQHVETTVLCHLPSFCPMFSEHPHLRYNPLLDESILVSPHRLNRPWQGKIDPPPRESIIDNDPSNPLCPGATRSNGEVIIIYIRMVMFYISKRRKYMILFMLQVNPLYESTFVFENDFPALLSTVPSENQRNLV